MTIRSDFEAFLLPKRNTLNLDEGNFSFFWQMIFDLEDWSGFPDKNQIDGNINLRGMAKPIHYKNY